MNKPLTEGSMLEGPKVENNLKPIVAPPSPTPVNEVEERENLIKSMTEKYNNLGQESYFITQMMNRESKTGRNNKCHCGSKKRFKKCCLSELEAKYTKYRELTVDMNGIAEDIKEIHKEIKEIKEELEEDRSCN